MTALELGVLDWMQANLRCALLDAVLPVLTRLGDAGIVWIALTLALLAFRKTRPLGLASALALSIDVTLCNGILKPLIARARPYTFRPALALLTPLPTDFSFPSGHTAASAAACSALGFCRSRLFWPALALAALIAFSRLYLYLHFPTDVLGGVAVGVASGALGAALAGWVRRRLATRK